MKRMKRGFSARESCGHRAKIYYIQLYRINGIVRRDFKTIVDDSDSNTHLTMMNDAPHHSILHLQTIHLLERNPMALPQ